MFKERDGKSEQNISGRSDGCIGVKSNKKWKQIKYMLIKTEKKTVIDNAAWNPLSKLISKFGILTVR